jgi:hypothetical protein
MIHLIFGRPAAWLKVYTALGALYATYDAGGDAWGNYGVSDNGGPLPPYGYDCWCPPGHFKLDVPQFFDLPVASEGYGQIPVLDIDADTLAKLSASGHAVVNGLNVDIGGTALLVGQLARYRRSAIMIHGGGSNDPYPLADDQPLCRTYGCTRMHNADWKALAAWLQPQYDGNTVIFSIIGDPVALDC